jgi:hypothetical protein
VATGVDTTLRVNRSIPNVTAAAYGSGIAVADLPTSLEPGQDYPVHLTLTLPASAKALRGEILVRSGGHTVGSILFLRATSQSVGTSTPVPTRTPRPIVVASGTPQAPVTTAPPVGERVTWDAGTITAALAVGESQTFVATFQVSATVANPSFRVYTRDGAVTVDASGLPAVLVPDQPYSLPLTLQLPPARHPTTHSATVLLRDGTRSLGRGLVVRIVPHS